MKDKSGKSRPWLFRGIRFFETLGLIVLLYGLASSYWFTAAAGAAMIVSSIKIYRRWFPEVKANSESSWGMSDGGGD